MDAPSDVKRALAEEIRAAIAESTPEVSQLREAGEPATADARGALARAADVLTPSIPAGAPLARIKRLVVRALRFLWRNQSSFNALSLAASSSLAEGLDRLRSETERQLGELKRRAGVQEARLTLAETTRDVRPPAARSDASTPPIPPGVYALFEERFRGSPEEISERQRYYLDFLREIPGPVLDVGSGRGEFLRLLAARGIAGTGIEANPLAVAASRQSGLQVEEADALEGLSQRSTGSLGAVVAFQVVEHWPPETIFRFLQESRRVLAPGGVLIVETINSDSLSALRAFYLDPTHVRPVPPEALRFLAEAAGFTDLRLEYRSPLSPSDRLDASTDNERKLNDLLFAPQDYALIALSGARRLP